MTNESAPGRDRILEIIAVLILGVTTLGTAWCGFEASQWNGRNADLAREASDQHVEAARLFGVATQKIGYDATMVAQYAMAKSEGNENLLEFYRTTLIRPDFLPILDQWEAEIAAGQTPTPLLDDADYLSAQLADYQQVVAAGEQLTSDSQDGRRQREQVRRHDDPARRRAVLRRRHLVVQVQTCQGPADRRGLGDDGLCGIPAVHAPGAAVTIASTA